MIFGVQCKWSGKAVFTVKVKVGIKWEWKEEKKRRLLIYCRSGINLGNFSQIITGFIGESGVTRSLAQGCPPDFRGPDLPDSADKRQWPQSKTLTCSPVFSPVSLFNIALSASQPVLPVNPDVDAAGGG